MPLLKGGGGCTFQPKHFVTGGAAQPFALQLRSYMPKNRWIRCALHITICKPFGTLHPLGSDHILTRGTWQGLWLHFSAQTFCH